MNLRSIARVLKSLKRRSGVLVCPKCGSPKISGSSPLDGWILPYKYRCPKCGYSGFLVLEVDERDVAKEGARRERPLP